MFSITSKGSFDKTETFLRRASDSRGILAILNKYGQMGVNALSEATPVDTSETAHSWNYGITQKTGSYSLTFFNSKMAGQTPLVILLTYGHGTKNGGFVQGRDFINSAIQPIFDKMATDVWKEVTK